MFADINDAWYPSLIEQAAELGLISGYEDGTFRPREPVTREQLIYFLMRYRERDIHQKTISDLVKRWKDSVVMITNAKQDGTMSTGSGSFIDDKGSILTNKHVTDNYRRLTVRVYGKHIRDAVFIRDSTGMDLGGSWVDLALIKIHTTGPTPPVNLAEILPGHGSFCLTMGAPLALADSATFGVVSHSNRGHYVQVDAAINPGNSGGACFDMQGNMIGVPTLKFVHEAIDNIAYLTGPGAIKLFLE